MTHRALIDLSYSVRWQLTEVVQEGVALCGAASNLAHPEWGTFSN